MSENERQAVAEWISYREEIRVMDCTIRDGGLMNDSKFSDDVVRGVYDACVEAGVDYMEIGYINSRDQFPPSEFGPWRHCREEDLRRIVGDNDNDLKLSAMADAEKSDYKEDILPADHSVLDMIRIATYIHQIPLALDMIKDAHDKGYETTLNLMAASTVPESEIDEAPGPAHEIGGRLRIRRRQFRCHVRRADRIADGQIPRSDFRDREGSGYSLPR